MHIHKYIYICVCVQVCVSMYRRVGTCIITGLVCAGSQPKYKHKRLLMSGSNKKRRYSDAYKVIVIQLFTHILCVGVHVCVCMQLYVCMYVCLYACMYVCMYMYVYIHIHVYI